MNKIWKLLVLVSLLSSCDSTLERLKRVGKAPELARVELPPPPQEEDEDLTTVRTEKYREHVRRTNSLWQPGNTTFFRDSRAWRAGDILKVVVVIQDSASLNNTTSQSRSGKNSLGIPALFGKEKVISGLLSKSADPKNLLSTKNDTNNTGTGNIARKENIQTVIAAVVTKVLPNGNLIIEGHQEVRVNYELREIKIAGIIRPKDISADNSINSDQIAEARISYGGRGIVSDVQQPRTGSQVLDIISPF
jgi:flagellar L-ring protein precursor FlgH